MTLLKVSVRLRFSSSDSFYRYQCSALHLQQPYPTACKHFCYLQASFFLGGADASATV